MSAGASPAVMAGFASGSSLSRPSRSGLQLILVYTLGLLLVLHAGLRPVYADLDSVIYRPWFEELARIDPQDFLPLLRDGGWIFAARPESLAKFEWGFSLLAWACGALGFSTTLFFLLVAALSILPKVWVLTRLTSNPVIALLWYASLCYLLLEMNAMRAGLAGAWLFVALDLHLRRRNALALFCLVGAASMHLSALAALVIPLLLRLRGDARWLIGFLLLALVLGQLDLSAVLALLGGMFAKVGEYKHALDQGFGDVAYTRLNPINLASLNLLLVGTVLLWRAARRYGDEAVEVGAKAWLFFLPLMPLFLFASFPIVGGRLFEFLAMFQTLGVAWLCGVAASRRLFGYALVLVALVLQFWIQNFRAANVDFFYFLGAPRAEIVRMAEQKIVIDAVLNRLFQGE